MAREGASPAGRRPGLIHLSGETDLVADQPGAVDALIEVEIRLILPVDQGASPAVREKVNR